MAFFHKVTKATTQDGEHEMAENEKKKKIVFLSLLLSIKPAPTGAHCFFPDPLHPWGGEDLSGNGFTVIMDTPPP